MIGRTNRQARGRLRDFGGAILAALALSIILGNGPLRAQAASPAPDATPPTTLPATPATVLPAEAPPASGAQGPEGSGSGAATAMDAALPSSLPHDLSPWGMFLTAVLPVKFVMVGLAFASLASWTVWLAKTFELWNAKRAVRRGLDTLAAAASLRAAEAGCAQSRSPVARLIAAAAGEADRSDGLALEGVKERAAILLSRIEAQAGRAITQGTGVVATIGATAPFVGLFGTVWGIMDSFIGISKSNTTNLAVVAPGIAEALLATALGLIAAIPAVVMYNAFARAIMGYRAQLGDAAAEVLRHLSRDLDREVVARNEDAAILPMRESAE